jgi:hypothetical protein
MYSYILAAQHVRQLVFTNRLGQRQASVVLAARVYSYLLLAAQQFSTGIGLRASCQHAAEKALGGGRYTNDVTSTIPTHTAMTDV